MTPEIRPTGHEPLFDAVLTGPQTPAPAPSTRELSQPNRPQAALMFGDGLDLVALPEHRPSFRHWGINE